MRIWYIGLALVLVMGALAGCGGQTTPTPVDEGGGETYTSEALDTSYDDALNVSNQLVLGTIQLEETEQAVTPEQAAVLLPLWQALQGGGVTAQAEVNALLRQIEGTMTPEQLEAIAAMRLTREDLQAWMQSQGLGMGGGPGQAGSDQGLSPDERATRQAEFGNGEGMPPEMATRRAEFENMSDEERANLRATMEAGGGRPGSAGGRPGQFAVLLNPLVELLTERAAE